MKIWLVTGAYLPASGYGGPITKVQALANEFQKTGHSPHIITSTLSAPGKTDLPSGPATVDGIPVTRLRSRLHYRWSTWPALELPTEHPDLIHCFGAWTGMSYRLMAWAFSHDIPVLWEPMGMLATRGRHAWLKRRLIPWHRDLARQCAGLVFTSRQEQQEAPRAVIEATRTDLRPNPVQPPERIPDKTASRNQLNLPQNKQLWGYLGRIATRKGIETLLAAWPDQSEALLVLAGPPEDAGLAAMSRARQADGVHLLDTVQGTAKWAFLRAIDALVLMPDFGENFGTVVAEAATTGTPVVASSAVGAVEWFDDPGIVTDDAHGLARRFRNGDLPPPPRGLPATLLPAQVAAAQVQIYKRLLDRPDILEPA